MKEVGSYLSMEILGSAFSMTQRIQREHNRNEFILSSELLASFPQNFKFQTIAEYKQTASLEETFTVRFLKWTGRRKGGKEFRPTDLH